MENEIPRLSPVWEHSLTTILGHDPSTESGTALRHWVHFQGVQSLLDLLSWDQEELKTTPATEVWLIAHFWMSYGRPATHGLPMGCSEGLSS